MILLMIKKRQNFPFHKVVFFFLFSFSLEGRKWERKRGKEEDKDELYNNRTEPRRGGGGGDQYGKTHFHLLLLLQIRSVVLLLFAATSTSSPASSSSSSMTAFTLPYPTLPYPLFSIYSFIFSTVSATKKTFAFWTDSPLPFSFSLIVFWFGQKSFALLGSSHVLFISN